MLSTVNTSVFLERGTSAVEGSVIGGGSTVMSHVSGHGAADHPTAVPTSVSGAVLFQDEEEEAALFSMGDLTNPNQQLAEERHILSSTSEEEGPAAPGSLAASPAVFGVPSDKRKSQAPHRSLQRSAADWDSTKEKEREEELLELRKSHSRTAGEKVGELAKEIGNDALQAAYIAKDLEMALLPSVVKQARNRANLSQVYVTQRALRSELRRHKRHEKLDYFMLMRMEELGFHGGYGVPGEAVMRRNAALMEAVRQGSVAVGSLGPEMLLNGIVGGGAGVAGRMLLNGIVAGERVLQVQSGRWGVLR